MTDNYITGSQAWERLTKEKLGTGMGRAYVLNTWWSRPERHPFAPFHYASETGANNGDIRCGCLTQVKGDSYHAETHVLTSVILDDPQIPCDIGSLACLKRGSFMKIWNHLIACQRAMRRGRYPGLRNSWKEVS